MVQKSVLEAGNGTYACWPSELGEDDFSKSDSGTPARAYFIFFNCNVEPTNKIFISSTSQSGQFKEDMIPTVGFNMKKVTKGNVTIKLWDIGGQPRFRSMWERYCRGVNAIVYVFANVVDLEKLVLISNQKF